MDEITKIVLTKDFIKRQAKAMQTFVTLKEGKKMKLSNCYECISQMWGFKNWNTFSAIINKLENNNG